MKAIVLVSGGLDSLLTIRAIQNQGIEPIAVHFHMPFVKPTADEVKARLQKSVVEQLGARLRFEEVHEEYLEMFHKPVFGYGKNLNPCMDCKILFLRKAKQIMEEEGASFLATGEVLGQRPMSQRKWSLDQIEQHAGVKGILLRPLCALHLEETIPQKEGWVKKELLHNINGRSRQPQMRLAKEWGLVNYPAPAGGCLVTDKFFCARLQDLLDNDQFDLANIDLVKLGRHIRVNKGLYLEVGKDKADNEKILNYVLDGDVIMRPATLPGPTMVCRGKLDADSKLLAAQIVARYTKSESTVEVLIKDAGERETITVSKIDDEKLKEMMI